ncbi:hypothetical protein MNEG_0853 [Monoraphidium neglectum]|uniref:CASTOR/POLLUX/SYM8 ion channel conserved domain-containing protein n=1 Tax=Monoraphidium neglectum TaxID=145388 RepID=A0A0D2KA00_9CHLO|nr:hypothetical protein MNEG_0853 [Monoraphidium neglectum]KIZ07098.1 hypothetical protein MNEG_0853 [Monoraphidium neglectum]|eukprot:XP_013906117.1 hypothetical protein MNEG_0853 [Monoraphidium neglectum]
MLSGSVVAEIQTKNSLPLLHYSCSPRVVALPTGQLNARRLSKMVKRPFISWVSQRMFNFENQSTNYVQSFPSLVGCRFGELAYRFPDGSVYGVAQIDRGVVELNPPIDYVIREADQLVICRPTNVAVDEYKPLPTTLSIRELEELAGPASGAARRQQRGGLGGVLDAWRLHRDGQHGPGAPGSGGGDVGGGSGGSGSSGSSRDDGAGFDLRGDGRGGAGGQQGRAETPALLWPTMLDGSGQSQDAGFDNGGAHPQAQRIGGASTLAGFGPLAVPPAAAAAGGGAPGQPSALRRVALDSLDLPHQDMYPLPSFLGSNGATPAAGAAGAGALPQWAAAGGPGAAAAAAAGSDGSFDAGDAAAGGRGAGADERAGLLGGWGRRLVPAAFDAGGAVRSSVAFIPTEYVEHDDQPEKVLVAGWAGLGYMADILQELDSGTACLPQGSEVVFVNDHIRSATLGQAVLGMNLQNVKVSHVKMDPLQRNQVARLDLSSFKCAIVLCDEHWVDPDHDESNGIESTDEPSMLRLDALMMTVQLNIRKTLADDGLPPINIICQKVASAGLTRFEDRHRLPLGISVNFTSFAAKMMAVVAYNPIGLLVYAQLGEAADLTFVDAQEYADEGESLSYWELITRAQLQGDLLMGWYRLPDIITEPIESVFNPQGLDVRGRKRIWNDGDGRLKFIIFRQKELLTPAEAAAAAFGDVIGDDKLPEAQQRRRLPSTRGAAAAVQQQIGGLGGAFTRVR